ncbi:MAG: hypothetical protein ACLFSE_11935, partial [Spirochaetia bacterium]
MLYSDQGKEWIKYPAISTAANIDDDPYEEVVIIYHNTDTNVALLKTMDYDASGTPVFSEGKDIGTYTVNKTLNWYPLQVSSGDADGDGVGEILFAGDVNDGGNI